MTIVTAALIEWATRRGPVTDEAAQRIAERINAEVAGERDGRGAVRAAGDLGAAAGLDGRGHQSPVVREAVTR